VKIFTAHTKADAAPVLVREGFTWGALVFGPLWLLAQGAWLAGLLGLCLDFGAAFLPARAAIVAWLLLAWVYGVLGRDILRWTLERRGFLLAHVVAARNADSAMARLLDHRPDLIPALVPAALGRSRP
jgi:hypothetical protein